VTGDPLAAARARPLSGWLRTWLLLTSVVSGAAVMAVELLGARMLNVTFGESLVIWAAMISVTLLSLAVGYFFGGWLVDRSPRPAVLYGLLTAAAGLTAICPHAGFIVDACAARFGLRSGMLVSSAILFFLPLGLMGLTGPSVIGFLARGGQGVGVTAGVVYAISTLGSVAGTLLTGLWLIPHFGTALGFKITAVTLAATGAIGVLLCVPRRGGLALLAPLGLLLAPLPGLAVGTSYTTPKGATITVLAVEDSAYGRLVVLEKGSYRLLVANGIVQTGVPRTIAQQPRAEALTENYFQELLPYTVDDPAGRRVLIIGLAGGMTASIFKQYGMDVEAVDLDPAVIALARRYFSFDGRAVAADGRWFLRTCTNIYDFCVMDTYSGDMFPSHLCSVEAFRMARGALRPGGILALNFIGAPGGRPFACIHRTLRAVFAPVVAIRGVDSDDVQTVTLMASDQPIEFNNGWMRHLGAFRGVDPVSDAIRRLTFQPSRTDGLLLTDGHNPISSLRAEEALRWRQRAVALIGRPR
jgi:spermidine synthase